MTIYRLTPKRLTDRRWSPGHTPPTVYVRASSFTEAQRLAADWFAPELPSTNRSEISPWELSELVDVDVVLDSGLPATGTMGVVRVEHHVDQDDAPTQSGTRPAN